MRMSGVVELDGDANMRQSSLGDLQHQHAAAPTTWALSIAFGSGRPRMSIHMSQATDRVVA